MPELFHEEAGSCVPISLSRGLWKGELALELIKSLLSWLNEFMTTNVGVTFMSHPLSRRAHMDIGGDRAQKPAYLQSKKEHEN